jgi:hypothetical protein
MTRQSSKKQGLNQDMANNSDRSRTSIRILEGDHDRNRASIRI